MFILKVNISLYTPTPIPFIILRSPSDIIRFAFFSADILHPRILFIEKIILEAFFHLRLRRATHIRPSIY